MWNSVPIQEANEALQGGGWKEYAVYRMSRAPIECCDRLETGQMETRQAQPTKKAGRRKGRKVGKPRGKTCHWTTELDDVLKTAWARGGLRAARRAIHQEQPTWSWCSIRKRAASLGLCRPRAGRWTAADENHLLMSIDSNASLALIAERLGRTVTAIRRRLWELHYKAESLGGFKVKEVAAMFSVMPARVQYWVGEKM